MRWALTILGLAENLRQARDGDSPGRDQVVEDGTRANGGELVHVSHEQHLRRRPQRLEQAVGQVEVEHRGLVHDEKPDRQRVSEVAREAQGRVVAQQPVDGLSRAVAGLGEAFSGPAGGGAEGVIELAAARLFQHPDDGAHRLRLAGTRPAGEHGHFAGHRRFHRAALFGRELKSITVRWRWQRLRPPRDGLHRRRVHQPMQALRHADLGLVIRRQIDGDLIAMIQSVIADQPTDAQLLNGRLHVVGGNGEQR